MIRNVAVTTGIRVALTVLALLTSILSARFLGPSGRGNYFFIITLSATIVQFSSLGMSVSNTWLVAGERRLLPALTTNSAWIAVGAAGGLGVAIAVGAAATNTLSDTPQVYLWLAAALAPPSLFFMLGSTLLVGVGRIHAYNAAEVGSRLVVFAAMLAVGFAGLGASGFVTAAIVAWTLSAIAVAVLVLQGRRPSWHFDRDVFRRGMGYAFKAYLVTLLGFLVLRSNVFLLRRDWGPNQLGLYSIAAQVTDVLAILPQTVALLLFPRLVRETGARWSTTVRTAATMAVVLTAVCAGVALLARPTIVLLFGAPYESAARVLYVMLPGVVMLGITGVFGSYLGAVGFPRQLVLVWAIGFVVLLVFSLALVPGHAGAGAAAALSAAYGVIAVGVAGLAWRYHRRHPTDAAIGLPIEPESDDLTPVGE